MWFEQVKEWLTWFFSLPLPIAGLTVGSVIIFLAVLFKKSSFGRKMYNKALAKVDELKGLHEEYKKLAEEKCEELKKSYEEKLQIVSYQYEELEKLLLAIGGNIHNKQIQDLIGEFTEKSQKSIAIADIVDDKVIEAKEEALKKVDEFEEKLQLEFDSKVKELETLISEVKDYGKERKDDKATEE